MISFKGIAFLPNERKPGDARNILSLHILRGSIWAEVKPIVKTNKMKKINKPVANFTLSMSSVAKEDIRNDRIR